MQSVHVWPRARHIHHNRLPLICKWRKQSSRSSFRALGWSRCLRLTKQESWRSETMHHMYLSSWRFFCGYANGKWSRLRATDTVNGLGLWAAKLYVNHSDYDLMLGVFFMTCNIFRIHILNGMSTHCFRNTDKLFFLQPFDVPCLGRWFIFH